MEIYEVISIKVPYNHVLQIYNLEMQLVIILLYQKLFYVISIYGLEEIVTAE